MAHGRPDWLLGSGRRTTYRWAEFDELAARLGSPVKFDRRGDVLFMDSFEDGLEKWAISLSGASAAGCLSTREARTGLFSVRLQGGSDDDRYASIAHRNPYPAVSALGVEFSFLPWGTIDNLEVGLTLYKGTTALEATVRWVDTQHQLQYKVGKDSWVTFATGVDLAAYSTLFHTCKLVMDPTAAEYVRCIVDDTTYSLAGIPLYSYGYSISPLLDIWVMLYSRSGQLDEAYVDDLILTQNE